MPYIIACDASGDPTAGYRFASHRDGSIPWVIDPSAAYVYEDLDEVRLCDTCSKCKVIKPDEAILLLMGVPID